MKNTMQKVAGNFYHRGLQLLFMGCVTGFLAGVVITFYSIFASFGEDVSTDLYAYLREHVFLIPLLFLALACAALIIGVVVKFIPMIKGSGIPQTEGAARGVIKYNWFTVLCTMFASSLACIFLGLSAGSEGPSIQMGGACGYGSSKLFTRTEMLRRYQITGGACTGLAVAFNAPLTGMAFAFEETHKKFSPEVFICAFSSVVTGVITRNLIRGALGLSVGAAFETYVLNALPYSSYGYLVFAALVCSLLGVGFYYLVIGGRQLIKNKVTFFGNAGKMLIPFLLAGVFGLITVYAMGGGHALIDALGTLGGTRELTLEQAFAIGVGGTLALALLFKFIATVVNMSCGVPCGAFIPMLAIGAATGALLSFCFVRFMGMDKAYIDIIVMISMAAFFTCVVRAPITGIVMVFELTWSFTPLLPVVVGVAIGYMVGEVAKTEPLYEKLLDEIVEEDGRRKNISSVTRVFKIQKNSIVDGMSVKDVLWPAGAAVKQLRRGEEKLTPCADTVLLADDIITVAAETPDPDGVCEELERLTGERVKKFALPFKKKENKKAKKNDRNKDKN